MAKTIKAKAINSTALPPPPTNVSSASGTVNTIPVSIDTSTISNPTVPIESNDLNASCVFTSQSLEQCLLFSRATFNVDLKINLFNEFIPEAAEQVIEFIENTKESVLYEKGLLSNFFYDFLDARFSDANTATNGLITQYYKDFFKSSDQNLQNLDFRVLAFTNNLKTNVGISSLQKDGTGEHLYQNLNLSLIGQDSSNSNSEGLTNNEVFKLVFFNSERFQHITPDFSEGNNVFSNLAFSVVNSVISLGKNQIKV